jgi:plasmid maintenance system antidote protein VapI
MKTKSEDFHKELARDMGVPEREVGRIAHYMQDILWRMNDDPTLPKPKEFDVVEGEKITVKAFWKTLTITQKRNLIKDARGETYESEFMNQLGLESDKHAQILPLFLDSIIKFQKTEK